MINIKEIKGKIMINEEFKTIITKGETPKVDFKRQWYKKEDFDKLIKDFKEKQSSSPKKEENIFSIAGYPHYENVASNILAFYFNPKSEHGLEDLLLSSLTTNDTISYDFVEVRTEVSTEEKGRIDIVIETNSHIIGIENKIFHILNNNLDDYSNKINEIGKNNNLKTLKIVLSLKQEKIEGRTDFINITYNEFIKNIEENLKKSKYSNGSEKWMTYLKDFITNIKELNGENMTDLDNFFSENDVDVVALIQKRKEYVKKLKPKIINLKKFIKIPSKCSQWIWYDTCLVHDFNMDGYQVSFDLYLTSKGWEFQVFGRRDKDKKRLEELVNKLDCFKELKGKKHNERYIIGTFLFHESFESIEKILKKWFDCLLSSANSRG